MSPAPGKPSPSTSGESGSGVRGCLSCLGCGCVFPFVGLVILAAAAVFLLPQTTGPSARNAQLPKPVEITREDRWSLQDKLAAASAQGTVMSLELTLPELNLLLARVDVKPAAGFFPNKIWSYISTDVLTLVLEGSGFWMRRLNIVLHLEPAARGFRVRGVRFNGHDLPEPLVRYAGIPWLERWLGGAAGLAIDLDTQTEYGFTLASETVTLTGPFPWLRTSSTGDSR